MKELFEDSEGGTATLCRQEWSGRSTWTASLRDFAKRSISDEAQASYHSDFYRKFRLQLSANILEDIVRVEEIYTSERAPDVKEYVYANQELLPVLLEAPGAVKRVFGDDVVLSLELCRDPEEGSRELFIKIGNNLPKEMGFQLERKLFREWFVNKVDSVGGKLSVFQKKHV